MKACPFCAEQIQDAAIKCRYCGTDLRAPSEAPKPMKVCVACAEDIDGSATTCPYCSTNQQIAGVGAAVSAVPAAAMPVVPVVPGATAPPAAAPRPATPVSPRPPVAPSPPAPIAHPVPPPAPTESKPVPYWTPGRVLLGVFLSFAVLIGAPTVLLGGFGFLAALFSFDGGGGRSGGGSSYSPPASTPAYTPPPPPPSPTFNAGQPVLADCGGLFSSCYRVTCPIGNSGDGAGLASVTFTLVGGTGEQKQYVDSVYLIPGENRSLTHEFQGSIEAGGYATCSAEELEGGE